MTTETAEHVAREEQRDRMRASCKSLPRTIMAEITSSCKVYSAVTVSRLGIAPKPRIRVICNIEAASGGTSGRKGNIHIEVQHCQEQQTVDITDTQMLSSRQLPGSYACLNMAQWGIYA